MVRHYDFPSAAICESLPLRIRSLARLIPLFAAERLSSDLIVRLPGFRKRMDWFLRYRPDVASLISRWQVPGVGNRHLLSLLRGHRMKQLLRRMLDESEFMSAYGVRALSKYHEEHPHRLQPGGVEHTVTYQPGEWASSLFTGNSNWRGPIWMPVKYVLAGTNCSFTSISMATITTAYVRRSRPAGRK